MAHLNAYYREKVSVYGTQALTVEKWGLLLLPGALRSAMSSLSMTLHRLSEDFSLFSVSFRNVQTPAFLDSLDTFYPD